MNCFISSRGFITAALAIIIFTSCNKTAMPEQTTTNNAWDGVYNCTVCNYGPAGINPTYSCTTTVVHLVTTDTNKVKIYWPLVSSYAVPSLASGSFTYFGSQEPELTINSGSNNVTVQNAFAAAVTFYTMSLSYPNNYVPSTRTFNLKFGYSYTVPGVFDATCREWTLTLTYTGPR